MDEPDIHTGMLVYDRDGKPLGTVDGVFHGRPEDEAVAASPGRVIPPEDESGADDPAAIVAEGQPAARPDLLDDYAPPPGTPPPVETSDQGLQDALGEPQMRRGFIHLSGSDLPEKARYVAFEQIEHHDDLRVHLKASRADLEGQAG